MSHHYFVFVFVSLFKLYSNKQPSAFGSCLSSKHDKIQDLLPKSAADHEEGHDAMLVIARVWISFSQMELLRLMDLPSAYDRV